MEKSRPWGLIAGVAVLCLAIGATAGFFLARGVPGPVGTTAVAENTDGARIAKVHRGRLSQPSPE